MGEPHGLAMPNSLRSVANLREQGEPQSVPAQRHVIVSPKHSNPVFYHFRLIAKR